MRVLSRSICIHRQDSLSEFFWRIITYSAVVDITNKFHQERAYINWNIILSKNIRYFLQLLSVFLKMQPNCKKVKGDWKFSQLSQFSFLYSTWSRLIHLYPSFLKFVKYRKCIWTACHRGLLYASCMYTCAFGTYTSKREITPTFIRVHAHYMHEYIVWDFFNIFLLYIHIQLGCSEMDV